MKHHLSIFFTISVSLLTFFTNAQEATDTIFSNETILKNGFEVDITLKNPSNILNDGIAALDVSGNQAPYIYKWSLQSASIYQNSVQGFTEGDSVTVEIIDDNGVSAKISKFFPAHFTEESINSNFEPIVNFVGSGIFWDPFAAMGIYPYSPGDAEYIVSVPLFNSVKLDLGEQSEFTISKNNAGRKIIDLTIDGKPMDGCFVTHDQLKNGKELRILTE